MNEKNDFALVWSSPSGLERAELRTKRALSSMVRETLALARKERPAKRVLRVLTCSGENILNDAYQRMIEHHLGSGYVVETTDSCKADDIANLVRRDLFDLIVPLINNVFTGAQDATTRISEAVELFAGIKAQYGTPIIAFCGDLRDWPDLADLPDRTKRARLDAFFWTPFRIEDFHAALEACGIVPDSARSQT